MEYQLANPIKTLKLGFEDEISAKLEKTKLDLAELVKLRVLASQAGKAPGAAATKPDTKAVDAFIGGGDKAAAEEERSKKSLKETQDALIKANDAYVKSLEDKAKTFGFTERQLSLYEASQKKLTKTQLDAAKSAIESTDAQRTQETVTKAWAEAVEEANKAIDDDKTAKANAYADAISRAFPERREGQQYADDVLAVNQALADGNGTIEERDAAISRLGEKFGELRETSKTFADEFSETWSSASRSFSDNFGRATADAILNQEKFGDIARGVARSFAREMIGALVSIAAREAIDFTIRQARKLVDTASSIAAVTTTTAVTNAALVTTAVVAAPAAAGVTLASFGANIPFALAGLAAVFALSKVLGQAGDGMAMTPHTGTYLLNKGEGVVKVEDNKKLQKFLDGQNNGGGDSYVFNINASAIDGRGMSQILSAHSQQIVGMVQSAAHSRGKRGPID